jgi:hypothetical protein
MRLIQRVRFRAWKRSFAEESGGCAVDGGGREKRNWGAWREGNGEVEREIGV